MEKITEHEYSLEIDEAEGSDEGTYCVVLSTGTAAVQSSCSVTVLKSEVAPTFLKGLQDQSVRKGSKLILDVSNFLLFFKISHEIQK